MLGWRSFAARGEPDTPIVAATFDNKSAFRMFGMRPRDVPICAFRWPDCRRERARPGDPPLVHALSRMPFGLGSSPRLYCDTTRALRDLVASPAHFAGIPDWHPDCTARVFMDDVHEF